MNAQAKQDVLAHPLFSALTQNEKVSLALADKVRSRQFLAGEQLYSEHEPSAGLWFIQQGTVEKVQLAQNGCQHVIGLLMPGDIANIASAFESCPNLTTAIAVTPVCASVIPSAAFQQLLQQSHGFSLAVIEYMVCKQRQRMDYIKDLTLRSATARVANFLLHHADRDTKRCTANQQCA